MSTSNANRTELPRDVPPHADRRRVCGWLVIVLGILAQSAGCNLGQGFNALCEQPIVDYRDTVWARRAYNLRYANCDREFDEHFREGFIDGYCSVCEGEDGYVPALPPENYMSHQFQSAEGSLCVDTWFKGYPLGAAAARKDGAGSFRSVYISNMANAALEMETAAESKNEAPTRLPRLNSPITPAPATPDINPELRLETPPKPVVSPISQLPSKTGLKTTIVSPPVTGVSRLEPLKIPVDPNVQTAPPLTTGSSATVQTTSGLDSALPYQQ